MALLKSRPESGIEQDIIISVVVSDADWPEANDRVEVDRLVGAWSANNAKRRLTGALLLSDTRMAHVLEGPAAAVHRMRKSVALNPLHGNVRLLDERASTKRRFAGWPLAFVGPSRWVKSALASRPLHEMAAGSVPDAEFLIDLILEFVGEGPFRR